MSDAVKKGAFPAWVLLAASVVAVVWAQGVTYSFAVLYGSLESEFGWSRGSLSVIPAITGLIHGFATLASGMVSDRLGPRPVILVGAVLIGAGLVMSSRVSAAWQLFLVYCIPVGLGTASTYVPLSAFISRRFAVRRGTALGLLTSGIGMGIVIVPLLTSFLLDSQGWRDTYLALGIGAALFMAGAAVFLRGPRRVAEARRDLRTDGGQPQPSVALPGLTLRQAVRTRNFWVLDAAQVFWTIALMMVMYHIVVYAETDRGISTVTAASFLSAIGISNIVGRFAGGALSDRFGRKRTLICCLAVQLVMMPWLIVADSPWMFYMFAIVWGFAYGGVGPMIPAMTGEVFGLAHMGSIFGLVVLTLSFGGGLGPVLAGYIVDATGSYMAAFATGAAALLLAVFSAALVNMKRAYA